MGLLDDFEFCLLQSPHVRKTDYSENFARAVPIPGTRSRNANHCRHAEGEGGGINRAGEAGEENASTEIGSLMRPLIDIQNDSKDFRFGMGRARKIRNENVTHSFDYFGFVDATPNRKLSRHAIGIVSDLN
jgi:hypothetical protein